MRAIGWMLPCALATLLAGCTGTIEDAAAFHRHSDPPELALDEAGASLPEADTLPTREDDAPGDAAAPALMHDGGSPREDDASAALDAAPARASDASSGDAARNDAGSDAGTGCDFQGLMQRKCGNAGCHGALAVSSSLDLSSDGLATRLAGRKATLACSGYLLIDRERPELSALYVKVTAEACGSRMPLGGTLSEAEQRCILQWITEL